MLLNMFHNQHFFMILIYKKLDKLTFRLANVCFKNSAKQITQYVMFGKILMLATDTTYSYV